MLIAITGGVGSGKSTVMEILKSFGANVISADEVNNEILKDPEYIKKIDKLFKGVVKDGEVDRVALGKKVFYDEKAMKKLNDLAHPTIIKETKKRIEQMDGAIFVEVPLLVESNMQDMFDKIWLVKASRELRLKRMLMRDYISEEYAKRIMASQATDKIRMKYATDIIVNSGDENDLYNRVEELYKNL
ncbi:MAG: dephospho-CoA kinase [Bacillota bacterium]